MTVSKIIDKYKSRIDYLDLELLIADSLNKTREFVLANPNYEIPLLKIENLKLKIARRAKCEPLAYILGHKEFYGLDFIVNKHTLIPRPETEQIIDLVTRNQQLVNSKNSEVKNVIIDIGTGSGNIIISIAKTFAASYELPVTSYSFFATDISLEALKTAKKNAATLGLGKKIKFLQGDLLTPIMGKLKLSVISYKSLVIVANLPYLSKEIYSSAPKDVKAFEPKSALYSAKDGLAHYEKLLKQIAVVSKDFKLRAVSCFLEISPEQKIPLAKIIKSIFPKAKITFHKDLAGKWRVCKIIL